MPQACSVCEHPQLLEVDAALAADEPVRATARMFGLTESALRRHAANHRPQESDETAPGGPPRPSAVTTDPEEAPDDVRSVARRRLEAEEVERRAGRLAALEAEEEARRDRVRREQERADALVAARQRLAVLRGELPGLDDDIERLIDELAEAIDKRMTVEREMYAALAGAGRPFYGAGFKPHLQQFLSIKLPEYVQAASFDDRRGAPLRERDPMAVPDGAPSDAA